MSPGEEPPVKNEFASFLAEVAEEISQRVQEVVAPNRAGGDSLSSLEDQRRIVDWPFPVDRIIEELR